MMMSDAEMLSVWPYLPSGGVPEIQSLDQTNDSVSSTLMSLWYESQRTDPYLRLAFLSISSQCWYPPWMMRLFPIKIAQWPCLGVGSGPVVGGRIQAMSSKSKIWRSLKKSLPFHPPNTNILLPPTRVEVCPNLAVGAQAPSGPWYQVILTGSRACKSLKQIFFPDPLPPKIRIQLPAKTAVWPYLGFGGVPSIFGLIHLDAFKSNTWVSLRYWYPTS